MGSRVEDLLSLAQMLDEGKINQQEYDFVKAELLAAPAEDWDQPMDVAPVPVAADVDESHIEEVSSSPDEVPEPTDDTQFDLAAKAEEWLEKARALPRQYRWGGGIAAVVVLGLLIFGGGDPPSVQAMPGAERLDSNPVEPPPESLGVRIQDLETAWNEAEIPPRILRPPTLTPESGPLDSFLYRFDDAAVLVGAYDPADGYVYGLMVRVGLLHESFGDVNTHLCHLLHPYEPACLDTFTTQSGVSTASLPTLQGSDHEASWSYEGNTWKLAIADDVETVRVLAPGQP